MPQNQTVAVTRALISVSDKTGIVEFAKALSEKGVEILSTGGTYKLLKDSGKKMSVKIKKNSEMHEMLHLTKFLGMLPIN